MRRAKEIERVKDEATAAFKAGRLNLAVEKYTETLAAIGERPEEGNGGQLRALILGNRALVQLKVRFSLGPHSSGSHTNNPLDNC